LITASFARLTYVNLLDASQKRTEKSVFDIVFLCL